MTELPTILTANQHYQTAEFHKVPRTPIPGRHLVILGCMDARLDLFSILGLDAGDAHLIRNAGGRATDDALRSLALSVKVLETREIGVIHHDSCGLQGRTNDELAELTGLRGIDFHPFDDVEASVAADVDRIRACDWLPEGVVVWGAVYDVDTGALRVISTPA